MKTYKTPVLGGTFTLPGTSITLNRIGFGAMQLCGPMAYGPPSDMESAIAVVRGAVDLGINHIDTSDYYGPHVANRILHQALAPYPPGLTLVTKVGARRGADKSWPAALSRAELRAAIHDNLANLGLDRLAVVNLRVGGWPGTSDEPIDEPLTALAEMQSEGLIEHIGLSNVTPGQYARAKRIAKIVCVQNHYNLAHRADDAFLDTLAAAGVAYVPFFPLGGFRPIKSRILDRLAAELDCTPRQLAIAWLLHRSPNILVIVGTSSLDHLRENTAAANLALAPEVMSGLDAIAPAARAELA